MQINRKKERCSGVPAVYLPEFLVQYEDSLHHRSHWHNLTEVPGTRTTAHLKLSPYVHYTFRVLALNGVGFSQPSLPSRMFKTDAAGTKQVVVIPPLQLLQPIWRSLALRE